jgi:hypothetical protein
MSGLGVVTAYDSELDDGLSEEARLQARLNELNSALEKLGLAGRKLVLMCAMMAQVAPWLGPMIGAKDPRVPHATLLHLEKCSGCRAFYKSWEKEEK